MARSYRYLHYDVFTDHLFGGNQLAVFLDGRGLPLEMMQAIAKEMNFSETSFVLPPETSDTDFRVRIFTPDEELPEMDDIATSKPHEDADKEKDDE